MLHYGVVCIRFLFSGLFLAFSLAELLTIVVKQGMTSFENCPHNILYITDEVPGYCRQRRGKGFVYLDENGARVTDSKTLQRIKDLVIPPMWERVWICKKARGHLQATGFDQRKRKQYLYHPEWSSFRQRNKYEKLLLFGESLPSIRKKIESDVNQRGWNKTKILAIVVMLLDHHYIRIGNKFYEKENETYGLTTLRRKHLKKEGRNLALCYKAKSGKDQKVTIESKRLARLVKKVSELPGHELFRYIDENGRSQPIDSGDVNEYLNTISGRYFTAKDFRTWGGSVLAVEYFEAARQEVAENKRLNLKSAIIKKVALQLNNTVAICREYYIHPQVLETLVNNSIDKFKERKLNGIKYKSLLSDNEKLVLKIIGSKPPAHKKTA